MNKRRCANQKEIIVTTSERDRETWLDFLNRTQDREEHNIKKSVPSGFSTQETSP